MGGLSHPGNKFGTPFLETLTKYSPQFDFRSALTGTEIELRDSSDERKRLFGTFHLNARKWLLVTLQKIPDDMRMVLQSYLSEMDESSQFSQHAPGRQLALEIGKTMATNDSKSGIPIESLIQHQCVMSVVSMLTCRRNSSPI
jgi:hypothetical protein